MDSNDVKLEEWVILNSPGGRYLGKVSGAHAGTNLTDMRNMVLAAIRDHEPIKLEPVFDFLAPIQPQHTRDGRVAMGRVPLVTPPDFTLFMVPVYAQAASVYFLGDLKEEDQKTYKELVDAGYKSVMSARAAAAGLEIPNGNGAAPMPGFKL